VVGNVIGASLGRVARRGRASPPLSSPPTARRWPHRRIRTCPLTPRQCPGRARRGGPARRGLWKRFEAHRLRRLVLDDFAIHPLDATETGDI